MTEKEAHFVSTRRDPSVLTEVFKNASPELIKERGRLFASIRKLINTMASADIDETGLRELTKRCSL